MGQIVNLKLIVLIFTLLMCAINAASFKRRPNPLLSYSIPAKRNLKKSLGYDEDTYLTFKELATKYNYKCEEHNVITEDGYILTSFRLIAKCNKPKRQYPILLMHGIMDSSDLWILAGPSLGLGYVLADNCYDVWVANHRGNSYSRHHVRLDPNKDIDYWNYTFDEHGNFDLPAIIDYIQLKTGQAKVNYIGHSQGTTDFFVMNSLRPEYNDKISISLHLAPTAWFKNVKSVVSIVAAQGTETIKTFLDSIGLRELLAKNHIAHFITEILCQIDPEKVCGTGLAVSVGYMPGSIQPRTLSVAFGHVLNGVSSKEAAHFGQLILSGNFQRYNEGRIGNIKRYGTPKTPQYNVSLVTSPVVLFSAENDWISTLKDVQMLGSRLPNLLENYVIPEKYWSHHNYVWDVKAKTYVFPRILFYLEKFN